jgi:hypothetical protein
MGRTADSPFWSQSSSRHFPLIESNSCYLYLLSRSMGCRRPGRLRPAMCRAALIVSCYLTVSALARAIKTNRVTRLPIMS